MATTFQEITNENGRVFRVGETPHDIMGRSRAWMVFLPWVAMMAVSVFEYGWSAAVDTQTHIPSVTILPHFAGPTFLMP